MLIVYTVVFILWMVILFLIQLVLSAVCERCNTVPGRHLWIGGWSGNGDMFGSLLCGYVECTWVTFMCNTFLLLNSFAFFPGYYCPSGSVTAIANICPIGYVYLLRYMYNVLRKSIICVC